MNCRHQRGSTFAETMAAVALIGIATLISGSLLNLHPTATLRLEAQDEALRVVEATLESVRAGAIPLTSATLSNPPIRVRHGMKVTLVVSPQETPNLYSVRIDARCNVRGQDVERHVSTMLWRPSW